MIEVFLRQIYVWTQSIWNWGNKNFQIEKRLWVLHIQTYTRKTNKFEEPLKRHADYCRQIVGIICFASIIQTVTISNESSSPQLTNVSFCESAKQCCRVVAWPTNWYFGLIIPLIVFLGVESWRIVIRNFRKVVIEVISLKKFTRGWNSSIEVKLCCIITEKALFFHYFWRAT